MNESDRSEKDLSTKYRNMADGELLQLAQQPWALSEAAWEALEDELDRRGLEPPQPDPVPQIVTQEKRNLVLLRRFRDIPEALLAKGKLESAGVECFLGDDNMVRMDWFISNLLGGVKLLVDAEDFTEASKILNEPIPDELLVDGLGKYVQPRCPSCGSLDIGYGGLDKGVAYTSAWLGVPIPLSFDGWRCQACGHKWEAQSSADMEDNPSL